MEPSIVVYSMVKGGGCKDNPPMMSTGSERVLLVVANKSGAYADNDSLRLSSSSDNLVVEMEVD